MAELIARSLLRADQKRKGERPKVQVRLERCYTITYMGATMRNAILSIRDRLDRFGVVLSGLCALHCLLSILAVSTLGLGGQVLFSPWIHRLGLVAAVLVGIATLAYAAAKHGRFENLRLGALGIGLMSGAIAVGHGLGEALLTIAGVSLVALAHLRNLRSPA
jgi:NO-binding membrane sensor protein with MHYT domain